MENRKLPKLDLNITNRCNFRCKHCAFDSGVIKMSELSVSDIQKILEDTREIGGERFDITGGEPLVREDTGEIIELGKNLGYKIELVTNGSLLDKSKLNKFRYLGLDAIAISLDGSNSEKYNEIRKRDEETFKGVIENIAESKKYGFITKINTVLFQSNLQDIENIINFGLKAHVNEVGLYYFTPVGRGNRTEVKSVEPLTWLRYIRSKLSCYKNCGMKISLEVPIIEKEFSRKMGCIANNEKSHMQILPDGNVYPCAIMASYFKPLGNLHDSSIKDLWNNEQLWMNYWNNISRDFENGYCVNFKDFFNIGEYDGEKYSFVCPIRKFRLEEIT